MKLKENHIEVLIDDFSQGDMKFVFYITGKVRNLGSTRI
jgi:hypothetical protein